MEGERAPDGPGDLADRGPSPASGPLHNGSDRDSSEVVQVYLHDPVAEMLRPVRRLIGAARVDLAAGESRTAVLQLHADLASYTGLGGRIVEPGDVELRSGVSGTDIRARLRPSMTGPRRTVGYDRMMQPEITILPRHSTPQPRQGSDPIVVDNGFRG